MPRIEAALASGAAGHAADRHDRRHRPDAARRDAAGDHAPSSTTRSRGWPRRCAPPAGRITPLADLSRGVVGVIGRTLVVNLPGSPKGAIESLDAIAPVLDHALETLAGPYDHGAAAAERTPSADRVRAVRRGPGYPLVFLALLGRGRVLRARDGPPPAGLRRGPRRRPEPVRRHPARFAGLIQYAFVQTKMFKDPRAGLMHAGIFWGFVLLTIGTANIVTGGLIEPVLSIPFDGLLWTRGQRDAERRRGDRPGLDRLGVLAPAGDQAARA